MFVCVPPSFSVRRIRGPSISYQFKCDNQTRLNLSGSFLRPAQRFHFPKKKKKNGRQLAQKEEKSKNDVCFGQGLSSVSVNKYLCTRRDKLATDKNETLGEAAKVRKRRQKWGKCWTRLFFILFFFPFSRPPSSQRCFSRSFQMAPRCRVLQELVLRVCECVSRVCVCVCVILLYEAGPRANIKLASIFLSTRFKLWQTTRLDKPKWKEKQKRKNNILSTVLFPLVYFLKRYKTHI